MSSTIAQVEKFPQLDVLGFAPSSAAVPPAVSLKHWVPVSQPAIFEMMPQNRVKNRN
jgi:hypothetical protein